MNDPYDLQRFVDAQRPVYASVRAELRAGHKQGHWMWFVFPQLRGLGHSELAHRFGIASRDEAAAYILHPILGPRLSECTRLVTSVEGRTIEQILGHPDDLKFRSSMTLFAHAALDNPVFVDAIKQYFAGEADPLTRARLGAPGSGEMST